MFPLTCHKKGSVGGIFVFFLNLFYFVGNMSKMLIGNCTGNRQRMKFKRFRKLKKKINVILNIGFTIMIFEVILYIFLKKC